MKYLIIIVALFGYNQEAIRNICNYWLDYVPVQVYCAINIEPNEVHSYRARLCANHIEGGWGVAFRDPNNCTNFIIFQRFNWAKVEQVVSATSIELTMRIDSTPDLHDNVSWHTENYHLDISGDSIAFMNPLGKRVEIVFHEIVFRQINLFWYAQVARGVLHNSLVRILFNEPLEKNSAEAVSNYSITPSIIIYSATLQADNRTVVLDTSGHQEKIEYTLVVNNVEDLSGNSTLGETKTYEIEQKIEVEVELR